MKKIVLCVAALATCGSAWAADLAAPAPAAEKRWLSTATLDFMYFSYRGTFGTGSAQAPFNVRGGGHQFYMPTSYSIVGAPNDVLKLEFSARTGYVYSRQTTAGFSGTYSGLTDTLLSATATYLGQPGFQPFLTVTTNLPTGTPALFGTRGRARLDPDFVDVPSFGEGFNVGVTAGANFPLTQNLVFNLSAGYTNRGAFTREGQFDIFGVQQTSRLDPGDSFALTASANYSEGAFTGQLQASFTHDTATSIDGLTTFRSGNRVMLMASGTYAFSDVWSVNATAMLAHGRANYIADPFNFGPGLVRETKNSNSNVIRLSLEPTYRYSQQLSFGPTASFLYRDNNAYSPEEAQFIPAKNRWAVGAFANYAVSDLISLNARVSHVWTRESATPDKFDALNGGVIFGSAFPRIIYSGWQVSGGVSARF